MSLKAGNWLQQPLDWRGRRVTVMGLGVFGGGEGAVRFLSARGASVTVTDLKGAADLGDVVTRIRGLPGVELKLGRHDEADFRGKDAIVASPAVRRDNPLLQTAIAAGVPLTSEMNLFWMHNRSRTIGVTGSNGKSTTASLIHAMLRASAIPARIGGNIGHSLLPEVENIRETDWTVLELSSFQLADLDHLRGSPEIAVVTNFAPNHLDHHASLDEYRHAKQTILRWQQGDDVAVLNAEDPDVSAWPTAAHRLTFGRDSADDAYVNNDSIVFANQRDQTNVTLAASPALPGRHNRMNIAAAALAAMTAGARVDAMETAIREFRSLPHRLEFLGEHAGRRFYNDSKATTPEAAIAALDAFEPETSVVLLAGGADKQVDLNELAGAIRRRAKGVTLLGQTARELERLIDAAGQGSSPAIHRSASLEDAFSWAVGQTAPGDVVLLSPGCASLDWFANYEDRGRQFAGLLEKWRRR